jgi:hypothetical protein
MTSRTKMRRKEVDDVLGGDEMWKHADATTGKPTLTPFFVAETQHFASHSCQLLVISATTTEHTFINCKSDPLTSP